MIFNDNSFFLLKLKVNFGAIFENEFKIDGDIPLILNGLNGFENEGATWLPFTRFCVQVWFQGDTRSPSRPGMKMELLKVDESWNKEDERRFDEGED